MVRDKPAPSIARKFGESDRDTEVIHRAYDTVSFQRGLGDSGRRIEVVEHDCPACHFDRMTRHWKVSPVERDSVEYYCLNPSCLYYMGDKFSYAMPRKSTEPHTVED